MSASKNLVILIGNLGKDPEIRYAPSGDCIANFTIATTEKWKDKVSGEMKEATEWHRLTAFGRLAEIVKEYVFKGSSIYVEGSLKTRKWQHTDGTDRYSTEIRVSQLIMLGGKREGVNSGSGGGYQEEDRDQRQTSNQRPRAPAGSTPPISELDDDIPFCQPFRGMQWLAIA